MKKTSLLTLAYAGVVFILVTAVALSMPARAQQNAQATRVDVVEVTRQPVLRSLSVPATVMARNVSDISFGVNGRLASFDYDVGDKVSKGAVLATLDKRQITAAIASLKAQQQAAEATAEDERQQLAELQQLAKTNFVAQSELRRAKAAVAVAEANASEFAALINERQVALDYHQLQAPYDAVVVDRNINEGEWVTQQDVAFRLVQQHDVFVDSYLAQRYLPLIDAATTVEIALETQTIDAAIVTTVPYVDPANRTFLLRLAPSTTEPLIVGSAVTSNITMRSKEPQLTVPQDAVIRYSDGRTSVWLAEPISEGQHIAREKLVTLGQTFNGWVAIGDSLAEASYVVVRGNESLTDGEALQITKSNDYGTH